MVQGLNQYGQAINSQQGTRCNRRPPISAFPIYLNWEVSPEKKYDVPNDKGKMVKESMGDRMEVSVFPRAYTKKGTAPEPDALKYLMKFLKRTYPNVSFVKGHMWNEEIGGPGRKENLVPLTSRANNAHRSFVETPLKEALIKLGNFYSGNNNPNHPDYEKVYGFRYAVEIEGAKWPTVTQGYVPNSIHVQIFPIKTDTKGNISNDNSIIGNAIPPTSVIRPKIDRLIAGFWIDQNGDKWILQNNVWTTF